MDEENIQKDTVNSGKTIQEIQEEEFRKALDELIKGVKVPTEKDSYSITSSSLV